MSISPADIVRLVWPSRPFSYDGKSFVFDDGRPAPSNEEIEAAEAQAVLLLVAEEAAKPPPPITRRQLKRWLYQQGLLNSVPALIAAIADADARALAQIDWDEAAVFEADNPLVLTFAATMGMTREQLHAAWIEAAQIL